LGHFTPLLGCWVARCGIVTGHLKENYCVLWHVL